MAYQQLSKLTSNVPEVYVPRDDESEYNAWRSYAAHLGTGAVNMEAAEIDDSTVSELVDLGIIARPGDETEFFGDK